MSFENPVAARGILLPQPNFLTDQERYEDAQKNFLQIYGNSGSLIKSSHHPFKELGFSKRLWFGFDMHDEFHFIKKIQWYHFKNINIVVDNPEYTTLGVRTATFNFDPSSGMNNDQVSDYTIVINNATNTIETIFSAHITNLDTKGYKTRKYVFDEFSCGLLRIPQEEYTAVRDLKLQIKILQEATEVLTDVAALNQPKK